MTSARILLFAITYICTGNLVFLYHCQDEIKKKTLSKEKIIYELLYSESQHFCLNGVTLIIKGKTNSCSPFIGDENCMCKNGNISILS